jgi:predicted Zn-dependent protease
MAAMWKRNLALATVTMSLAACAVNPVTGERDLILVSGDQERAMGAKNYAPMQQSQGGVYDVDPELTAYVRSVGMKVANASSVDLPYEFVILNNSVPNAWALPGGKIAINRGLLTEMNSEAELAAVLGHEVVHAAARHSAQQQSRAILTQGVVVATTIAANDSGYGNLAAAGAGLAGQLTLMKYGRGAELESDKYGMRYMAKAGYDPEGAVTLQETFVRLSEGRDQDWLSGLFASHPPSQERVDANRKRLKNMPAGGVIGADRYQAAMARTRQLKPAYDAYDAGRKALAGKDTDAALSFASTALDLFPGEAHFHALRGDVRLVKKQYEMAVTNFGRAIERRSGFFYYHLQRGLARKELGQTNGAFTDLSASVTLLPTAPAHFALGEIEAGRGNTDAAIGHYRIVAKSGGDYGKAAGAALAKLDLPGNPSAYVAAACGDDGSGQIVVRVRNDSGVAVTAVTAAFEYVDTNGSTARGSQPFPGVLEPGKVASARTGLVPLAGSRCAAQVSRAQISE